MPVVIKDKETKIRDAIRYSQTVTCYGKIEKVVGMTIESSGPEVNVGDLCLVYPSRAAKAADEGVKAEVIGIREKKVLLMPFEDISGIGPGSIVESTGAVLRIPVGDGLMGRIIDGIGNPIDGEGEIKSGEYYPVQNKVSNPLDRPRIDSRITMGVKAIDGLLTCGEGQRLGIFAGSGVGKSTLLGMIARNVEADINIIALVGERGREVREFMERDLKKKGMDRSVLVIATSDQSAMMRLKCAMTATTIAEYFKDKGKKVLLMMDSLTRFAMAQREIGLAVGEPPIARGYTPSLYKEMPKLLERAGKFNVGSITGIYTVLVEGDDVNEPISDTVRGIIDGHIVLSRDVAMKNHYPAIDILGSISRLMNDIVDAKHLKLNADMRELLSTYNQNYDLINTGAYKKGSNAKIEEAINKIDKINAFLKQEVMEVFDYNKTVKLMADTLR
ncbi:MAG: flagellar protein export ATPase FliI [Oscillospiraceae bacterium]|nr:flagellar protein export ATPase FliI [Oscillospiraceae bacterium]